MTRITQTIRWAVGGALLASAVGLGVLGMATAARSGGASGYGSESEYSEDHDSDDEYSEDHDSEDEGSSGRGESNRRTALAATAPVDAVYRDECGSCHMAYPPGLLPSVSWRAIMQGLDSHFGENAELLPDTTAHVTTYLQEHASDRGDPLKHDRLLGGMQGRPPLRITELPFFKDEHEEIPARMVEGNPEVQTFSRCAACHRDA